jgi:GSH-dependent disulfide-bond oxidoreductase
LLEELGVLFEGVAIDPSKGEQLQPEFLKVSPNGRIPALKDSDPADGGEPMSVFESGAILIYLADKYGHFLPRDARPRTAVLEWIMWQMAGLGPTMGQARHFRFFAPAPHAYSIQRFTNESSRLFSVLDARLRGRDFICGEYSIADMCCWPWLLYSKSNGQNLADFPDLARWFESVGERAAVKRVARKWWEGVAYETPQKITKAQRAVLFGRTRQ